MLSRRALLAGAAIASASVNASTEALSLHEGLSIATGPTGKCLIGSSLTGLGFKNHMMGMTTFNVANADIPKLDPNGYPTSVPSSNIFGQLNFPSNLPPSEVFILKWSGSANLQLARGAPGFKVVSDPGRLVQGGTEFNLTVLGSAASNRMTFQFATSVPSQITFNFLAARSGSFDGSLSGLILCRLSDEAALAAATKPDDYWSDDYVAAYQLLNCGVFRPMGWTNPNGSTVSQSRYLPPWQTSMNCSSGRWVPGAWAGSTSGTNSYVCSAQPDANGSYVDGEMIQLIFVNASTSKPITINSGSRGAVPLFDNLGGALSSIDAATAGTLTYDNVLGGFVFNPGPPTSAMPYELQVGFANRINAHYWCSIPQAFDRISIAAVTSLIASLLGHSQDAYFEYSNEVWNPGFPGYHWVFNKGLVLKIPNIGNRPLYGYWGLRIAEMMPLVSSTWTQTRPSGQLKRVLAFQAYAGTNVGINQTYLFEGADLSTSLGYAGYNSLVGANHNSAPKRPIDGCELLSYAPYYSGGETLQFDQNYVDAFHAGLNFNNLIDAADNYAAGGPGITTALSWIDNDVRRGLQSNGSNGSQTLADYRSIANLGLGSIGVYPSWEKSALRYGKAVACYEGGFGGMPPSAATCATIGISTAYGGPGGKIDNLIRAYRKSSLFYDTVLQQFSDFMAQQHSRTPGWLLVPGPNAWSLSAGDEFAAKYESWNALVAYNG